MPEQACKEMGYSLDQLAAMLGPGGTYDPALISLIMSKTVSSDEGKIVRILDAQVSRFCFCVFCAMHSLFEIELPTCHPTHWSQSEYLSQSACHKLCGSKRSVHGLAQLLIIDSEYNYENVRPGLHSPSLACPESLPVKDNHL